MRRGLKRHRSLRPRKKELPKGPAGEAWHVPSPQGVSLEGEMFPPTSWCPSRKGASPLSKATGRFPKERGTLEVEQQHYSKCRVWNVLQKQRQSCCLVWESPPPHPLCCPNTGIPFLWPPGLSVADLKLCTDAWGLLLLVQVEERFGDAVMQGQVRQVFEGCHLQQVLRKHNSKS